MVKKNQPPSSKKNKSKKISKKVEEKIETSGESVEAGATKRGRTPSLLRGMKDILPREEWVWLTLFHTAERLAKAYGFSYMETPVLEEASLFVRSIGRGTDVVEKEMYVFEDRDGTKVGIRPEFTAGVARAYIAHGLHSMPQPVKAWLFGPVFRHDRPQAGRFRQFHQFDCEVLGERDPILDAELVVVAYNFLRDLGIDAQVDINSIGSLEDRERYTVELLGFLRTKRSYLCEDCKKRMGRNPLRVLDCKEPSCAAIVEEAPQIIDWLSDTSKSYFMKVLEYLDDMSIPYLLRSTLVRGLDYYTDTVFELFAEGSEGETTSSTQTEEIVSQEGAQQSRAKIALGGGGRYDRLIEQLGGRPTPASGFAIGLERVVTLMREKEKGGVSSSASEEGSKIFIAQLGEQARRRALLIVEELRRAGIIVRHNLGKPSLKAQLELANKYGTTHTLIIGQKEVQDGTMIVRDMESGIQETIDQKKVRVEVEKILREAAPTT